MALTGVRDMIFSHIPGSGSGSGRGAGYDFFLHPWSLWLWQGCGLFSDIPGSGSGSRKGAGYDFFFISLALALAEMRDI
eukprot:11068034-Karenia_brevis.AAC.1